jgi:hypothetical protein
MFRPTEESPLLRNAVTGPSYLHVFLFCEAATGYSNRIDQVIDAYTSFRLLQAIVAQILNNLQLSVAVRVETCVPEMFTCLPVLRRSCLQSPQNNSKIVSKALRMITDAPWYVPNTVISPNPSG